MMHLLNIIKRWRRERVLASMEVLLCYYCYFIGTVLGAKKPLLSEVVRYYEYVSYPQSILLDAHRRARRSLDTNEILRLDFKAHARDFQLRLKRESLLFSHNLFIEDPRDHLDSFQTSNIYEGMVLNEPTSFVHGFIHHDIFEGRIHCNDGNVYHIESAKQYDGVDDDESHSIIYNVKDVIHGGPYRCGVIEGKYNANPDSIKAKATNGSSVKTVPSPYSGNIKFKNSAKRRKRAVDSKPKLECPLHVRADPTYVKYVNGDKNRAMYLMTQHIKAVSSMFALTDFNGDGASDGYTIVIKEIGTIDTSSCTVNSTSNNCQFENDQIGAAKFLDLVSTDDHSRYCLSYVFSHRNFDDGILGLAWTGFPESAQPGGICDSYKLYGGVKKTLNTGIITNTVYGRTVPATVTDVTLAHEIAHNFGSAHDKKSKPLCVPGGKDGNYLMYSLAQDGSLKNNFILSPCSKTSIWENIQANADKCFQEKGKPICGNRVVEAGEDCDCGNAREESCRKDPCCNGATSGGYFGCRYSNIAKAISPEIRCSPSQGICCSPSTCRPYLNNSKVCSRTNECSKVSTCTETSFKCSKPDPLPERSFCNHGASICIKGECLGSLCLLENKQDCQCVNENDLCKVCCQDKINASCQIFKLNSQSVKRPMGSPCNQHKGRCDILSNCQNVDEENTLSRLRKMLFGSPEFINIYKWAKGNWWACVLMGLGLMLSITAFVWCCKQFVPSDSKRNRNLGRPFLCINRNPEVPEYGGRLSPSAPTSQSNTGTRSYLRTPSDEPPLYDDSPPGYNTALREARDNLRFPPSYELEIIR